MVILKQELGEPFRIGAKKKPVDVEGIEKSEMKTQKSLVGYLNICMMLIQTLIYGC